MPGKNMWNQTHFVGLNPEGKAVRWPKQHVPPPVPFSGVFSNPVTPPPTPGPTGWTTDTIAALAGNVTRTKPWRDPNLTPSGGLYRYLATDGSDTNPGTLSQPFATFAKAVTVLNPGDLLYVRAGTHTGPWTMTKSGSLSQPIAISAYPGESPVVTVPAPANQAALQDVIALNSCSYVTIHGLEVIGSIGSFSADPTAPRTQTGIIVHNAGTGHQFLNNRIHKCAHCGIKDEQAIATDLLIEGNDIYDCGVNTLQDHGIYLPSGGHIVRGNCLFRNCAWGIHLYAAPAELVVYNNFTFENGKAGILQAGADGVFAFNVSLRDGTAGNWGGALWLFNSGCTGNQFLNNVYAFPVSESILTADMGGGGPTANLLDYSVVDPQTGAWDMPNTAPVLAAMGAHNLSGDPLVTANDLATHTYDPRLQDASPAKGHVTAVTLPGCVGVPTDPGLFSALLYEGG